MMSPQDIHNWQQAFRSAPAIWYTTYIIDGCEENSGNFYDSQKAAEEELKFAERYGRKNLRVRKANIHNLELSKTRWNNFQQPAPTPPEPSSNQTDK